MPRMAIGLAGKGRAAELKVPMTGWIITRNQRSEVKWVAEAEEPATGHTAGLEHSQM